MFGMLARALGKSEQKASRIDRRLAELGALGRLPPSGAPGPFAGLRFRRARRLFA